MPEVREMLLQGSVTMTERYAHLAPDKLKDAARALDSRPHYGHTKIDGVLAPVASPSK
ncbi:MAG: hypothetical protein ACJ0TD_04240 [Arenicellales bacterium]